MVNLERNQEKARRHKNSQSQIKILDISTDKWAKRNSLSALDQFLPWDFQ